MNMIELPDVEKAHVRKSCRSMYNRKEFADTLLVFQGGEVMAVNRLVVGLLFPYLASSLELKLGQDPVILLPDYHKDQVTDLLNLLFEGETLGENDFEVYSDMFVEENNGNNPQNKFNKKSSNENVIDLVDENGVEEIRVKTEPEFYNENTGARKRSRKEVNYCEEETDGTQKKKSSRRMTNTDEHKTKVLEEESSNSKRIRRPARKQINYSEQKFENKEDKKKNIILSNVTDQSFELEEVCDDDNSVLALDYGPKDIDINEDLQDTAESNNDFHDLYSLEEFITYIGEFGMLHTATRKSDEFPVVVKEVKKENVEMSEDKNIPLEAFLWKAVKNIPTIIQLINYYETSDSYYYVMERPDNSKDLATFMQDWKEKTSGSLLPEPLFKKLFVEIVKTVIQCQDEGVVHGDIKDENILIDIKTANIKLSDLSSAKAFHKGTYNTYTGTPAHAPPEWTQEGRYTADGLATWSLGVLLHTMACGNSPFQTEEQAKRVALILPKLSPELRNLISCCLKSNAKERIKLREILNHSWVAR